MRTSLRLTALGVIGAALVAVPAGLGIPPVFEDTTTGGPTVHPAGVACPFGVRRQPVNNSSRTTTFSDGRTQQHAHGDIVITNLASGASTVWQTRFTATRIPGVGGADDTVDLTGKAILLVRASEPSPLGGFGPALLGVTGHLTLTVNPITGLRTSSSLNGQALDICAVLAG